MTAATRTAVLLVLLAVACGDGTPSASPSPAPSPSATGQAEGLPGFPTCERRPGPGVSAPLGASLPHGAVVESLDERDPLVYVRGYVEETPLTLRERYETNRDLEVLVIEDEVLEVEALVTDGGHRTFFKANAVCATGSTFIAVVAPEVEASLVPTPTGPPG